VGQGRLGSGTHQRLLALKAPTDLAMEALRSLRTSLHFARFKTKNNVLMITAPSPGVGRRSSAPISPSPWRRLANASC